ncbi:hypothetical protein BBBOND_0309640 [Babesia bigemina]|uniref:Uncharacterized protein n=1 Tax=Babesia bigemina TaxID=5866 RepID=A0A061D8M1_BABBI|nr:hypothetical protein BBBOND_0309640 [Babesia bigemina]CDR97061.1 hypothetical protein BBBOND_0309640 [Babesia bigemina]|eukprot:XP_012769247.1 hypothetical protein BBBOND_0309640 [Babesia bigemina]
MQNLLLRFLEQDELKYPWLVKELLKRFNTRMAEDPKQFAKTLEQARKSDYKNVVRIYLRGRSHITKDPRRIVNGCENFLQISRALINIHLRTAQKQHGMNHVRNIRKVAQKSLLELRQCYTQAHMLNCKVRLDDILKVVGYKGSEFRADMRGSDVLKVLSGVDESLLYII